MYVFACVCVCVCLTVYMWKLEKTLHVSGLSFHHEGPGNRTQGIRLGSKWLYSLSLLSPVLANNSEQKKHKSFYL